MLITAPNLSFFFADLDTRFGLVYGTTKTWFKRIAQVDPCSTEFKVYAWSGMLSPMRKWDGPRVVETIAPQTYIATPDPFEKTIGIDRYKLEDDTYDVYFGKIKELAILAAKWPDWQIRDLLQNTGDQTGSKQYGLDGLTHWSAVHPIDIYDTSKGTYCNDFGTAGVSINGVTVGGYLSPTAYSTLWSEFSSRKAENGQVLGVTPDLLVSAPQLRATANSILQAEFLGLKSAYGATDNVGPASNVLRGWSDYQMVEDLAAQPTAWFLFCTSRGVMPLSWVERQAVQTVVRNQPTDPAVFDQRQYLWGLDSRGTPAWSHAFLSARSGI